MNKWILGARIKTLPAAIAPVIVGTSLADQIKVINALLALIVSLSLQIAVNYANDFSDGVRGTDTNRVGPTRLVASNLAPAGSVKNASFISFFVAIIAGTLLAFNTSIWLIAVGLISILAAWGYTGGKKPYGYLGFGEVAVFIFFGIVATVGSYYVQVEQISSSALLLSIPMGSLSCAILVINNLRDLNQDKLVSKRTLAVKLGDANTRIFYLLLLVLAQVSAAAAASIDNYALLTLLWLPLTYSAANQVLKGASGKELITILGKTSRLQFLLALTLAISLSI
ncbi:1,4-dihydroxy-2-naphthoate octaprenyltransferase [Candidatus Nanopelagicus abundans]|uniref:1,4-dihydroxy-2-naphthoate octaprenyltransferase n=1 Tax=Candidatus Nanopelagicus abundans TaxID=1884916 RepID=A0A249L2S7_9ACTN|nr:1,4-dihydroxy-2-naphthoate polyprenyltransferase [Candidatus Nanopelagicus abundans]ASY23388.1 1,4-dihydroxy-2-naphthoate octaprenyltransferase [Candidatus Nanopelagicus abundans]